MFIYVHEVGMFKELIQQLAYSLVSAVWDSVFGCSARVVESLGMVCNFGVVRDHTPLLLCNTPHHSGLYLPYFYAMQMLRFKNIKNYFLIAAFTVILCDQLCNILYCVICNLLYMHSPVLQYFLVL